MRRGEQQGRCRVCGCSWARACPDPQTGMGCHWVAAQQVGAAKICSVCDFVAARILLETRPRLALVRLVAAQAFDPLTGDVGVFHAPALEALGLVRRIFDEDRGRTVYWATRFGREVARRLQEAKAA